MTVRPAGPLRPTSGQFARIVAGDRADRRCYSHARYGIDVISELCIADYPDSSGEAGPHWHISASTYDPPLGRKRRPTNIELEFVTDSFGISIDIDVADRIRFEEDNHEPGRARRTMPRLPDGTPRTRTMPSPPPRPRRPPPTGQVDPMTAGVAWLASATIVAALVASSILAAHQIGNIDQPPTTTNAEQQWRCGQLAHDTPVSCWVGP